MKHHSFLAVFHDNRNQPLRVSSSTLGELSTFLRSWLPMSEEAAVAISRELRRGRVVMLEGLATLVPDAEVPVLYFCFGTESPSAAA